MDSFHLINLYLFILALYRWYCRQKLLCHAQIIVAIFVYLQYLFVMGVLIQPTEESPFFLLRYLPWSCIPSCFISFTMIEGVIKFDFFLFYSKKKKNLLDLYLL